MSTPRDRYLDKGYYIALENGMYTWTGYCAINRLYMSAWGPDTLQEVFERVDETLPWLKRFDQNMAQYFCAIKASLSNARDVRDDWRVLPESIWPNADAVVDTFKRNDDFIGLLVNATCRLTLANWHGDYRSAIEQATIGERYVGAGLGMAIIPVFHFHRCLAYAAAYSYVDPAVQAAYLEKIASILPKFELWSQHAPRTYGHRLLLIQAELARIEGNTVAAIDLLREGDQGSGGQRLRTGSRPGQRALCAVLALARPRQDRHAAYGRGVLRLRPLGGQGESQSHRGTLSAAVHARDRIGQPERWRFRPSLPARSHSISPAS